MTRWSQSSRATTISIQKYESTWKWCSHSMRIWSRWHSRSQEARILPSSAFTIVCQITTSARWQIRRILRSWWTNLTTARSTLSQESPSQAMDSNQRANTLSIQKSYKSEKSTWLTYALKGSRMMASLSSSMISRWSQAMSSTWFASQMVTLLVSISVRICSWCIRKTSVIWFSTLRSPSKLKVKIWSCRIWLMLQRSCSHLERVLRWSHKSYSSSMLDTQLMKRKSSVFKTSKRRPLLACRPTRWSTRRTPSGAAYKTKACSFTVE